MTSGIPRSAYPRLTAWLQAQGLDVRPPLTVEHLAGGLSNLTYRLTDADGRRWALRRPPHKAALPLAHDMGREHRILAALDETPVPTPRVYGHCSDEEVLGAPFLVMEYVEGLTLRTVSDGEGLDRSSREQLGAEVVDVLGALHRLRPDEVGLNVLGRGSNYVGRQLRVWKMQLEAQPGRVVPRMDEIAEGLGAAIPPQQAEVVTHGDYRLDNILVGSDGRVRAVVDWELCTIGDPLADFALALAYWTEPDNELHPLGETATLAPGFASRDQLMAAYASRTGLDLSGMSFYMAFAWWKFAAILEGVYQRHLAGAYDEGDGSWRRAEWVVPALVEQAARCLDSAGT